MSILQDTWKILQRPSVVMFARVAHNPEAVRNRVYIWVAVCGAIGGALIRLLTYNDAVAMLAIFDLKGPGLETSLLIGLMSGAVGALVSFVVLVSSEHVAIRLLAKRLPACQTRQGAVGFSAQLDHRGDITVQSAKSESGSEDGPVPAVVTLALENGDTTRVSELFDVVDEKRLLSVTVFQRRYLESVLAEPGEAKDGAMLLTVPKEALSTLWRNQSNLA
ncbi:MAG: hypothetical protein ACYDEO_28320 [Aggregatilineales bacterium]